LLPRRADQLRRRTYHVIQDQCLGMQKAATASRKNQKARNYAGFRALFSNQCRYFPSARSLPLNHQQIAQIRMVKGISGDQHESYRRFYRRPPAALSTVGEGSIYQTATSDLMINHFHDTPHTLPRDTVNTRWLTPSMTCTRSNHDLNRRSSVVSRTIVQALTRPRVVVQPAACLLRWSNI